MKNSFLIASFLYFSSLLLFQTADARSGCCSHHGGVCGCGCCDGSPLSAICAPYYPECNSNAGTTTSNTQAVQTTAPTATRVQIIPHPTATLTPTTTPTMTPKPTKQPTPKPTKKKRFRCQNRKPQSEKLLDTSITFLFI